MSEYARPRAIDEALGLLQRSPGRWLLLAGGTDFYPARVGRPIDHDVLDLTRIASLRGIDDAGDHLRIGALTTWSELIAAGLPVSCAALQLAAREVGGAQIQNAGTIAGNLCNASPAADGVPPLLALDAEVELASAARTRRIALAEFIRGSRRTALAPDEIVTAILVPKSAGRSAFLKLGARRYLLISIVMAAAVIETDAARVIRRARIAVGSCSAVAKRLVALEARLAGRPLGAVKATLADLDVLTPITDVRGTAEYRCDAAVTLVNRVIEGCAP